MENKLKESTAVLRNSFQAPSSKQLELVKPQLAVVVDMKPALATKEKDKEKARMILLDIKLQLAQYPEP